MGVRPYKIVRRSIFIFLQNYEQFAFSAAILALPLSLAVLLSQIIVPAFCPSLLQTIFFRLETLFQAFGLSPTLLFVSLLISKLSQTISLYIFTLPFSLTFLLMLKAFVIQCLKRDKSSDAQPFGAAVIPTFVSLFYTYICNSILIVAVNSTAFALTFLSLVFMEGIGFFSRSSFFFISASGAVLYSMILANSFIVCNLALTLSAIEKTGGFLAVLKACVLIQGRASTALFLALPLNLSLAGLEALFRFRIVRNYFVREKPDWWFMAIEGTLLAYLYSLLLVLDTVVSWNFYKSCKSEVKPNWESECLLRIQDEDDHHSDYACLNVSKEIP